MKFCQTLAFAGIWFSATYSCFGQAAVPAQRINVRASALQSAAQFGAIQEALTPLQDATIQNGNAAGATNAGATATGATANPERTKQRAAILGKLTFDRLPSSILKAWSKPFKEEEDKGDEPDDEMSADENAESTNEAPVAEPAAAEANSATPLTAEQQAAKDAANKARTDAEELAKEIKALQVEVRRLKHNVTLGNWSEVAAFLTSLENEEPKSVFRQLLQSLVTGPPDTPRTRNGMIIGEQNVIKALDVISIG